MQTALASTDGRRSGARRRLAAWALLVVALPLLTLVLHQWRTDFSLESTLLLYLTLVVIIAALGGVVPGLIAAVVADLLVNYFLIPPYGTLLIESRDHVVALGVFIVVAAVVSVLVELASRSREAAAKSETEAEVLARLSEAPVGQVSVTDVLSDLRNAFALTYVALERLDEAREWRAVAESGSPAKDDRREILVIDNASRLVILGPERFASDQRALRRMASTTVRAHEEQRLAEQALESQRLSELDRTRSALLAAVGHDLRTPLAGVKAAVGSLRQDDVTWSDDERRDLLATIEESADRLTELVNNLLDATRIQAGAVVVDQQVVALEEVVFTSAKGFDAETIQISLPSNLPFVTVDPVLFERVLVNLIDNAQRYRPPGTDVQLTAQARGKAVELLVIDHGPGLVASDPSRVFDAFQHSDDRSPGGAGLGLAIVKGFCDAMSLNIEARMTEGGGLTMAIELPVAS